MSVETLQFSRRFQVWSYSVGHLELLLRSTKSREVRTRIDILFKNVGAICLPTTLESPVVSEVPPGAPQWNEIPIGDRRLFSITGQNYSGYVIAGAMAWHEDELEYHEPSHFSSSGSSEK